MTEQEAPKAKGAASGGKTTVGLLYFLDASGGRILSVKPNGSDRKVIVTAVGPIPDGIVVDAESHHIYWTNMGNPTKNDGSIERVGLDGKNRTTIVPEGGTFTPKQLHLEKKSGKLYLTALTDDYFSVPEEQIKDIESVLTMVDGKIVHATEEFSSLAPPPIPVLPEWSPVKVFGGYGAPVDIRKAARAGVPMRKHQHETGCYKHGCAHAAHQLLSGVESARNQYAGFFGLGCDCFAF